MSHAGAHVKTRLGMRGSVQVQLVMGVNSSGLEACVVLGRLLSNPSHPHTPSPCFSAKTHLEDADIAHAVHVGASDAVEMVLRYTIVKLMENIRKRLWLGTVARGVPSPLLALGMEGGMPYA